MIPSSWRPHGLIRDYKLEAPYLMARITQAPDGNIINPKEPQTIALFENLFQDVFFASDDFVINSQRPPATNSSKACDL